MDCIDPYRVDWRPSGPDHRTTHQEDHVTLSGTPSHALYSYLVRSADSGDASARSCRQSCYSGFA